MEINGHFHSCITIALSGDEGAGCLQGDDRLSSRADCGYVRHQGIKRSPLPRTMCAVLRSMQWSGTCDHVRQGLPSIPGANPSQMPLLMSWELRRVVRMTRTAVVLTWPPILIPAGPHVTSSTPKCRAPLPQHNCSFTEGQGTAAASSFWIGEEGILKPPTPPFRPHVPGMHPPPRPSPGGSQPPPPSHFPHAEVCSDLPPFEMQCTLLWDTWHAVECTFVVAQCSFFFSLSEEFNGSALPQQLVSDQQEFGRRILRL